MSVIYSQLRVSESGQRLYVNAHVNQATMFDNMYVKKITVCTENQVSELAPEVYNNDFIYRQEFDGTDKEVNLVLDTAVFNAAFNNYNPSTGEVIDDSKPYATKEFSGNDLSHNMFFVYIDTTPIPAEVPCCLGGETSLGVTFDYGQIYQQGMGYTRELADNCEVPQNYMNFIMQVDALKIALETEHFVPAIGYWKRLTGTQASQSNSKPCGCHG